MIGECFKLKYNLKLEIEKNILNLKTINDSGEKYTILHEQISSILDSFQVENVDCIEYSLLVSEKSWIEMFLNKFWLLKNCLMDENSFMSVMKSMLIKYNYLKLF